MKKLSFVLVSVSAMFPVTVFADVQTQITPGLPEPTSLILIISGMVGVFGLRRIFKK